MAGHFTAEENRKRGFKPGFDPRRNLKGRPVASPYTDELRRQLVAEGKEADLAEVVDAIIKRAKSGDVQAQTLVAGYLDGRPKLRVEHSKPPGGIEIHAFRHMSDEQIQREMEELQRRTLQEELNGDASNPNDNPDNSGTLAAHTKCGPPRFRAPCCSDSFRYASCAWSGGGPAWQVIQVPCFLDERSI